MTRFLAILALLTATVCHAAPMLIGSDAASQTDSMSVLNTYGQIQPGIIRIHSIRWDTVEIAPGVYDWTQMDKLMAYNTISFISTQLASNFAFLSNAVQPLIMFNVFMPPPFVTNSPIAYRVREGLFVRAVLLRYPKRIYAIEVINEPAGNPNLPQCHSWQDIAQFTAKLAIQVKAVLANTDSNVLVAGPSLTMPYDDNFFGVFAANGGFKACDIVTFHDYRMSGTGPDNARTYNPYENYGGTNLAGCFDNANKWSGGKPICVSELGIGSLSNVIAYAIIAQRKGVWAVVPHYWLGCATNLYETGWWDGPNNCPKPSGIALIATVKGLQ